MYSQSFHCSPPARMSLTGILDTRRKWHQASSSTCLPRSCCMQRLPVPSCTCRRHTRCTHCRQNPLSQHCKYRKSTKSCPTESSNVFDMPSMSRLDLLRLMWNMCRFYIQCKSRPQTPLCICQQYTKHSRHRPAQSTRRCICRPSTMMLVGMLI